jgi:hypothetical protein
LKQAKLKSKLSRQIVGVSIILGLRLHSETRLGEPARATVNGEANTCERMSQCSLANLSRSEAKTMALDR